MLLYDCINRILWDTESDPELWDQSDHDLNFQGSDGLLALQELGFTVLLPKSILQQHCFQTQY